MNAIPVDPRGPSTLYAATWTKITPGSEWVWEVRDVEVNPDSKVYAATSSGLMQGDGSTWTKVAGLPSGDLTAVAIDTTPAQRQRR